MGAHVFADLDILGAFVDLELGALVDRELGAFVDLALGALVDPFPMLGALVDPLPLPHFLEAFPCAARNAAACSTH